MRVLKEYIVGAWSTDVLAFGSLTDRANLCFTIKPNSKTCFSPCIKNDEPTIRNIKLNPGGWKWKKRGNHRDRWWNYKKSGVVSVVDNSSKIHTLQMLRLHSRWRACVDFVAENTMRFILFFRFFTSGFTTSDHLFLLFDTNYPHVLFHDIL